MGFFRNTPKSNTGDIEMLPIPSAKRLGNKTRKDSSYRSSNLSSRNASIGSVSAKRLRKFRATQIYTKRSRYSRCRGLNKSACQHKKICKFTKGKTRKYCRKKYNKHI
jgi:hypothetical protein